MDSDWVRKESRTAANPRTAMICAQGRVFKYANIETGNPNSWIAPQMSCPFICFKIAEEPNVPNQMTMNPMGINILTIMNWRIDLPFASLIRNSPVSGATGQPPRPVE